MRTATIIAASLFSGASTAANVLPQQLSYVRVIGEPDYTITLQAGSPGALIPNDFGGLSFETSAIVQTPALNSNANLKAILSVLGTTGHIRFGGNTSDTLTPLTSRVTDAANFVASLGSGWTALYGLSCPQNNPTTAANYASLFAAVLGTKVTFQIGNEPNFYSSTFPINPNPCNGFSAYQPVWQSIHDAVVASVPTATFAGADSATTINVPNDSFYSPYALNLGSQSVLLTEHLYSMCSGTDPASTVVCSWTNSLLPTTLSTITANANVVATGLPLRISESGTSSIFGIGNTLGAAISMLWEMQLLVQYGWKGIDIHGGDATTTAPAYSPVLKQIDGTYKAQATLYSIMLFKNLQGCNVLPVTASLPTSITVNAVKCSDGTQRALILNKTASAYRTIGVASSGPFSSASAYLLTGPSYIGTSMTIGGALINSDGSFSPTPLPLSLSGGNAIVTLPPSSAAVVILSP